jgi:hypothetical protein
MKRSDIGEPRLISWMRSHPKKDYRPTNPGEMTKIIFIADVVAAHEHETIKRLHRTKLPAIQIRTLELKTL